MNGRSAGVRAAAVAVAGLALLGAMLGPTAAEGRGAPDAGAADRLVVDAGAGDRLVVEPDPFQLRLVDRRGRSRLATVTSGGASRVRVPGVDGPEPFEPLGGAGAFPAFGWVVGTDPSAQVPLSFFAGNRLFGAEAGAVVSATRVLETHRTRRDATLELATDAPSLGPATMSIRRLPDGGVTLELQPPPGLSPTSTVFTLSSPQGEGLYGLGARKDSFDQRGRLRNVWVEQQNATDERVEPVTAVDRDGALLGSDYTFPNGAQAAYYAQAVLHGGRGWTAWVGQSTLSRIDLASSRDDAIRWGVAGDRLTLSLAGGGLERSARAYSTVAGRAPAPPRYVYEPWIDVINEGEGEAAPNGMGFSGGARVKSDLREVARRARTDHLPIGVLGVEGWQEVPEGKRFFDSLRRRGFHLSAYWNPFTSEGSEGYPEAARRGVFVDGPNGEPFPIITNRGGRSFVIDFSNPRALGYWKDQIERSCDLGFEAFMHDFGEFVVEGMRFRDGQTSETMHNAYPALYHRAARLALRRCKRRDADFDPFFYVRSGYSGTPATRGRGVQAFTSGVFPGDETPDWSQGSGLPSIVPAMLNLAMSGSYTFTTDVGGYFDLVAPRTSPELFARWAELAAFTPVSRVHNSTFNGEVYPWTYGDETLGIYRRYARAKVRLIPLVNRLSHRAARTGRIGPVRPLALDDPSPAARSIDDQWLLGRRLLVAPVLERGATSRPVYLPRGSEWRRVGVTRSGRLRARGPRLRGGRRVVAPAPLDVVPLYRRVR